MVFDIPLVNVHGMNSGDKTLQKQFVQQTGIVSSALEHAVPEQLFVNAQNPGEAISAVKALQKANAQGQRIYHITQANQAAILGNIHHDVDTMDEIRNALNAGKEVITHTDAVSVPGWSGAGYIITDPDTGAGAYKIAGGGNGSFLAGILFANSALLFLALIVSLPALGVLWGIMITLITILVALTSISLGTIYLLRITASGDKIDNSCFVSGIMYAIGIGGIVGGLYFKAIKSAVISFLIHNVTNLIPGLPTAIDCLG